MALLSGNELQLGAHYLIPKSEFTNQGSTTAKGTPITGGNSDGGEAALVPNFFYMHDFSDKWKAGIGITAPYGLATEYDDGWVGRYHALRSELATLNINPSVAYKINDQWSLGVGVSFQRAEAELTTAIDYGTGIDLATLAATGGTVDPGLSQTLDGKGEVDGDDWGYGANVGLIFEPIQGTRLGLHYRSKIDHTLEGDAKYTNPAGLPPGVARTNTTATAEVSLPETVSISAFHAFNERWAILADATWFKWDRLKELRIKFGDGSDDSVTTLDWDNTWRLSLGGIYKPTDPLVLRAGVAFDESPVPNEKLRTPRIPDADRIWLTIGGGYQFTQLIRADFAYSHLFVDDPKLNKDITEEENLLRGALVGEYDASVDIISASISFQF
jgi:long-chain fatty acid transport protein